MEKSIVDNYEERQQAESAGDKKKWWQRRSKAEKEERKKIDEEFKKKEKEAKLQAYRNEKEAQIEGYKNQRKQRVEDIKKGKPVDLKAQLYKYAIRAKNNLANSGSGILNQSLNQQRSSSHNRSSPVSINTKKNLGLTSGQGFRMMIGGGGSGQGFARMIGRKSTTKKSRKRGGKTIIIKT